MLAARLLEDAKSGATVFGIDGVDGCGKSKLGASLGQTLGWPVISLDGFLEKERGSYVQWIRYADLRQAVANARGPMVVEGVCLLEVLERAAIHIDKHIYVRRVQSGLWMDADECDFD